MSEQVRCEERGLRKCKDIFAKNYLIQKSSVEFKNRNKSVEYE